MAPMIMTLNVWRNEPTSIVWSDLTIPTSSHNKWPSLLVEWLAACSRRRCFFVIHCLSLAHSDCLVHYFVSCSTFKAYSPSSNQTKQKRETWRLCTGVVGTIHMRAYQWDLLAINLFLYIYDEMPWWCFNSIMTNLNMRNRSQLSPDLWKELSVVDFNSSFPALWKWKSARYQLLDFYAHCFFILIPHPCFAFIPYSPCSCVCSYCYCCYCWMSFCFLFPSLTPLWLFHWWD